MYWSFLEDLLPNETDYVENIKSTTFILSTNTKSTILQIHELDATEEKYFHSTAN